MDDWNHNRDSNWGWSDVDVGGLPFVSCSMLIRPAVGGLPLVYDLRSSNEKHVYLEPAEFVATLSRARGRVYCKRLGCRAVSNIPHMGGPYFENSVLRKASFKVQNYDFEIYNSRDAIYRCALASLIDYDANNFSANILLEGLTVGSECVSCAIRASPSANLDRLDRNLLAIILA